MALPSSERARHAPAHERGQQSEDGQALLHGLGGGGEDGLTVVDVGTGSGAIALAIAAHTPPAVRLVAADVSPDALAVASTNAVRLGQAERVTFVQSDLLAGVDARANLIVANLPYVSRAEWGALAPDISSYEPHLALDGGADGLELYRRLLTQVQARLAGDAHGAEFPAAGGGGQTSAQRGDTNKARAPATLLLEIGWQQGAALRALVRDAFPRAGVQIIPDLAGQDRVALIELRNEP